MPKTSIEWTDQSWPVINGCRRISAGCENCYAERLTATRLSKTPKYQGLAVFGKNRPRWTGETRLWAKHLDMPLRLRKPSKIFVCDMGDLFYEGVSNEEIAAIFGVMAACPQHTFQVLTKRPKRMRDWFAWISGLVGPDGTVAPCDPIAGCFIQASRHPGLIGMLTAANQKPTPRWPLSNVWLGVSAEDQATADERIPLLLETPAAVRFISYEPALGPLDIKDHLPLPLGAGKQWNECLCAEIDPSDRPCFVCTARSGLDWVIVGGESGPGARPFDLAWAELIVNQCKAVSVPVFVKQLGAWAHDSVERLTLNDRKGGDINEFPEALRVREFPR